MNKSIKIVLGIFFIISIFYVSYSSSAETQIEIQEGEINVVTSPRNPQPYEDVTVTLSSYATDLNMATISWTGNSGTVLSGIGKTSYSFKAPGPNANTVLDINIRPVGSMSVITKRVVIAPSEIELLWESVDGYTPPFYKGKALPSKGGFIKAVAIPNTDTIKSGSGSISYTWKNNDSVVPESSGYNKNSYIFKNDIYDDKNDITVLASSVSQNYSAEKMIEIQSYAPFIIFYKKSPTEGTLYNEAINKETSIPESETTIVAEPYFLSIKNKEDSFLYTWKINGDQISTPSKKRELTVKPTSAGGYADVSLLIESAIELFQSVGGQIKLNL